MGAPGRRRAAACGAASAVALAAARHGGAVEAGAFAALPPRLLSGGPALGSSGDATRLRIRQRGTGQRLATRLASHGVQVGTPGARTHARPAASSWWSPVAAGSAIAAAGVSLAGVRRRLRGARRWRKSLGTDEGEEGDPICVPTMSSLTRQRQHICLPELTQEEYEEIAAGRQVRKQERHGKQGWGFSVEDVDAPPSLVMDVLSNFGDYADVIPVVRQADVVSKRVSTEGVETARCNYKVSRFWLNVSVFQTAIPDDGLVHFELDPSVTGCVLQEATGFWHVAPAPGGSGSRVWLCVGLRACGWLPTQLVDYAAERALRRATVWLKPHMQRALSDCQPRRSAAQRRAALEPEADASAHLVPTLHMLRTA